MTDETDADGGSGRRSIGSMLVPGFVRRRYALKFGVSILVVLVIIAGVGALGYVRASNTVEHSTENQLTETSSLRADSLSNWVESMRVQTRSVSAGTPLRRDRGARAYLKAERSRLSEDIISIHYVNATTGRVAASTDVPIEGRKLGELNAPWTNASVATGSAGASDEVWVSRQSYTSPILDSTPVIAFASAVPGHDDRYVVVVSRIQTHLDTIVKGKTEGTTRIVNAQGDAVLKPRREVDAGLHRRYLRTVRQNGGTAFQTGDENVHAYARVEGTPWVAITTVDKGTAFAVRDTVGTNVAGIVIASLLSLGLMGAVLARQTVTPLGDLRDKARSMEGGDLAVDFSTGRVDEIGRLYGAFGNMRDSLRARIRESRDAREEAEVARARAEDLNEHLERTADEYAAVMQECASGDLTARMTPEGENEAMTEIAEEFNAMIGEIDRTVARLRAFSAEVASASEAVTASTEEVQSASRQVTGSIQEISDGAERQNEQFQAVSNEMDGLSTTTEQIAASSNQVADLAEQTAQTGRAGRRAAQRAIQGMREMDEESTAAVEEIDALEEEMAQVDELLEFITEVAEQTNMLALNANIEASRGAAGGDDSAGFAVVAQEVKDLAAETKEAAENIEARIEQVKAQTERAATEVQTTSERVEKNTESVAEAVEALDEIADYAQETNTGVQEISAATEEQAASTQEVVAMVDEAATISEETTAEAENVAAAAEEQTTALDEVSGSASSLAGQASQLEEALSRFDTRDDVDAGDEFAAITDEDFAAIDEDGDGFDEDGDGFGDDDDGFDEDGDGVDDGISFEFGEAPNED